MRRITFVTCYTLLTIFANSTHAQTATGQLFVDADAAREKAITAQADALSPSGFKKAERQYNRAEKAFRSGRNETRIIRDLSKAEALYKQATQNAEIATSMLEKVLESRKDAKAVEASRRTPTLWDEAERNLGKAIRSIERGRLETGRKESDKANALFRDAELNSIKVIHLNETKFLLIKADELKVDKFAPLTLSKSKSLLAKADKELDRNRYDTAKAEELAEQASYEARHSIKISENVRSVRDGSRTEEQLILYWEEPLEILAAASKIEPTLDKGHKEITRALEQKLTGMSSNSKKLDRQLNESNKMIADLEAEIREMDSLIGGLGRTGGFAINPAQGDTQQLERLFDRSEAIILQSADSITVRLVGLDFPSGSAKLPANSSTLNKISGVVDLYPNSQMTIEGHTDSSGRDDTNLQLSQARADSLMNYMVQALGVPRSRVRAIGYGETSPVADNKDPAGREENRRIDLVIFSGPGLADY